MSLQEVVEQLQRQMDRAMAREHIHQSRVVELQAELDELRIHVGASGKEIEGALRFRIVQLEKNEQLLAAAVAQKNAEIEVLMRERSDLFAENAALKSKRALPSELEALKKQGAYDPMHVADTISQLQKQLSNAREREAGMVQHIAQFRAQVDDLQVQLNEARRTQYGDFAGAGNDELLDNPDAMISDTNDRIGVFGGTGAPFLDMETVDDGGGVLEEIGGGGYDNDGGGGGGGEYGQPDPHYFASSVAHHGGGSGGDGAGPDGDGMQSLEVMMGRYVDLDDASLSHVDVNVMKHALKANGIGNVRGGKKAITSAFIQLVHSFQQSHDTVVEEHEEGGEHLEQDLSPDTHVSQAPPLHAEKEEVEEQQQEQEEVLKAVKRKRKTSSRRTS
jgi:hypothetical protein